MTTGSGRLAGRCAFITGAGAGIAKVASMLFAREGAKVAVIEINEEKGAATARAVACRERPPRSPARTTGWRR